MCFNQDLVHEYLAIVMVIETVCLVLKVLLLQGRDRMMGSFWFWKFRDHCGLKLHLVQMQYRRLSSFLILILFLF